ncbi:MAG: DUF3800 domain-containing protein [Proteobacteria bacterium]|nr:DUF3800 domain-containing protein [Pseudomonadota bacterium]
MKVQSGNFVMFVDETGDHNMQSIDPNYSVFGLVGCVFERAYYRAVARPMVDAFKVRFFGASDIVLHSRDIRKHQGVFAFLGDSKRKIEFYEALNDMMRQLDFTILAVVILKSDHLRLYGQQAQHPYHLALSFIVERYERLVQRLGGGASTGYVLAESRGEKEDRLLKDEYQRLSSSGTYYQGLGNITGLWMRKKEDNIVGLQVADLVAYPIAVKTLRPGLTQKSFDVLFESGKIDGRPSAPSRILGYGLKVFPQPTFDHYSLWG